MREFKFRAFHDGKMLYNTAKVRNALYWNNGEGFDLFAFKQPTPAVLMQYIGFVDRNDVDIYEGDIIKDEHNRIMLVEWYSGRYRFKALTKTNFMHANDITQWFESDISRPVIIGNHHENPELLGGVKKK